MKNIDYDKILSLVAHKELANILSSLNMTLEQLFAGQTSVTIPVALHQDMINVEILKSQWPDENLPNLLDNGNKIVKD